MRIVFRFSLGTVCAFCAKKTHQPKIYWLSRIVLGGVLREVVEAVLHQECVDSYMKSRVKFWKSKVRGVRWHDGDSGNE